MKYKNLRDCFRQTIRNEGVIGLFQGYWAYAPKSFLSSALLFTVYEKTYKYLNEKNHKN